MKKMALATVFGILILALIGLPAELAVGNPTTNSYVGPSTPDNKFA